MTKTICPDAAACPYSEDIASRVMTLPTYYDLALEDMKDIAYNVLEIAEL